MMKRAQRNRCIVLLAWVHRYIAPVILLVFPLGLGRQSVLLTMGTGFLLYSAWTLAGYLLRWKHIFCSYQNVYHHKMTPDQILWSKIKKTDAYGVPAIFGIIGLAMLLCHVLCV